MVTWLGMSNLRFFHFNGPRQLNPSNEAKLQNASKPVTYIGADARPSHMWTPNFSKWRLVHGYFTFLTFVPFLRLAARNTIELKIPYVGDLCPTRVCRCLIAAEMALIIEKDFLLTTC